jgi:hypothetical protein
MKFGLDVPHKQLSIYAKIGSLTAILYVRAGISCWFYFHMIDFADIWYRTAPCNKVKHL